MQDMQQSTQDYDPDHSKRVRISYALLISRISSPNHPSMYLTSLNFGSWSPSSAEVYKSVGGVGLLTPAGKERLIQGFGATDFENGLNAQFIVDREHIQGVMRFFALTANRFFETSPRRRVSAELCTVELPNQLEPILTAGELQQCTTTFRKVVQLGPNYEYHTMREVGTPTYRFFRLFDMFVPNAIYEKFANSKICRLLDTADIHRGFVRHSLIGRNVII